MAGWRRPGVACGARSVDGDEEVQASCCYHAAEPEEEVQWSACSDNPCKRSTEAGVVTCGTSGACGVFTHTSPRPHGANEADETPVQRRRAGEGVPRGGANL